MLRKTELVAAALSSVGVATGVVPPDVAAISTGAYVASRTLAKLNGDSKEGLRTTEFWVTVATQILIAVLPVFGVTVPAPTVIAGLTALYSLGRGVYKLFVKGGNSGHRTNQMSLL